MYDYIIGNITFKQLNSYRGTYFVIETGNIGYYIMTGKRTFQNLNGINEKVKVFVSLSHKEDSMNLIGFLSKEERDIFNILQSVSGIGLKLALLILDEFSIPELVDIMIREDYKSLSRAKGVGVKVAQKIILELKDKLINWTGHNEVEVPVCDNVNINNENIDEVQSVLISLGYTNDEIKNALNTVLTYKKDCMKTEDILKYSLEYLSKI